jgi:DNA repair exonuclease SbcCD ATPase subunit
MSDTEILHYLDLYSDDPLIRRLINVLAKTRGALIDDLEHAGMDSQSWTFGEGWGKFSPGQYIEELRNDVRRVEDELELAQEELEQMRDERDQLKTRNITQFIEEVKQEKKANQDLVKDAMATVQAYKKENERLKEQIDMWGRLNHVKQGA